MLVQPDQTCSCTCIQPEQSYSSAGATRTELNSAGQNLPCISWWFKLQNVIINQILHFNTFRACLIRLPHLPGVPHLHVNTGPLEGTYIWGVWGAGPRISPSGYHKGIKKERKTSNFSEIYLNWTNNKRKVRTSCFTRTPIIKIQLTLGILATNIWFEIFQGRFLH